MSFGIKHLGQVSPSGLQIFGEIARLHLPVIRREIDTLIREKEKNEQIIQNQLELLMNLLPFEVGTDEFLKLFDYYHQLYPENGKKFLLEYVRTLQERSREILESEMQKQLRKYATGRAG